jgi:iron complex outermembrane recepter protein
MTGRVFSDILVAKNSELRPLRAGAGHELLSTPPTISPNSPNNPTNPDSPIYDPSLGLDPQPVNVWHRFDALGNRDNYIDSEMYDFLAGIQGYIGPAEVEFGARWTKQQGL